MFLSKRVPCFLRLAMLYFAATAQSPSWRQVEPGIYKTVVGEPETYNLISASGALPYRRGLDELGNAPFPLSPDEINAVITDGKTNLRLPLRPQEKIFGFGLNFQTVNQRGRILTLHEDTYAGRDDGHTHAPTPFYVSSRGYGVFVNSARYLKVYAGSAVRRDSRTPPRIQDRNTDTAWSANPYSDAVEIQVPAKGVEVYVFAGPSPVEAIRRFILFNGGGCLPPRWGLGFTQRLQRLTDAAGVLAEAEAFEDRGFPLDFIGLEPGWQSKSYPCTFEWDSTRFPAPKQMIDALRLKGVRVNLWSNPYVSPESPVYSSILPYTGTHTVWNGVVADLTMPEARALYFREWEKNKIDIGVSGFKIDEVDGDDSYLWPDVATFPSGHSAEQMRQTYGLLMQRYVTDIYRKRNQRTYGLVRASNAGGAAFPFVIYNDYYDHRDFITALVNSGFAGVLWTPEVRSSPTAEEWLRRFQSTVFSPMAMINAWDSGTKPWTFPEVADAIREMAHLRMRMMPYWYSEFAKYHFQGIPPFRAMDLERAWENAGVDTAAAPVSSAEKKPRPDIKDQYMAGENILVAPMFAGQSSRLVVLPPGDWFDFYTGERAGNGETITVRPGPDKIPLFVKDGGIIPLMPVMPHAPVAGKAVDIEVHYYGHKAGRYLLYDDDGETFDYEKGAYSFREITVSWKNGRASGTIGAAVPGKPNTVGKVRFLAMTPASR